MDKLAKAHKLIYFICLIGAIFIMSVLIYMRIEGYYTTLRFAISLALVVSLLIGLEFYKERVKRILNKMD